MLMKLLWRHDVLFYTFSHVNNYENKQQLAVTTLMVDINTEELSDFNMSTGKSHYIIV